MNRSAGTLLHISSLPSPYGIGTLGREAFAFADFLKAAGQKYWQVLPLGPTSYGDSPYQSLSSFAGNPYLIDLDLLTEEGLLTKAEIESIDWGGDPLKVDYGRLYEHRFSVLRKAFAQGFGRDKEAYDAFCRENESWLPDYALFMAVKAHFGMAAWTEWEDEDIRLRKPEAMAYYAARLQEDVNFYSYVQFLFDRQFTALREYLMGLEIQLIGDLPIYVALDSADVWAEPESFLLDEERRPTFVAGVPPDYFSATGQLWGNPLYDWARMQEDGYGWWLRRLHAAARRFDVIRIDHFRGLESYWRVPAGEATAINGEWAKGPGMGFIRVVQAHFPDLAIIAEDLGFLTPEVHALLDESGYPGMKVLQFAFDPREPGSYLPHNHPRHCVCYTGTHDNTTAGGWFEEGNPEEIAFAKEYLGLSEGEGLHWGLIRGGMGSVADLFVAQMQDYLGLGAEGRMNTPSTLGGNWQWRMQAGDANKTLAKKLAKMAWMYGR